MGSVYHVVETGLRPDSICIHNFEVTDYHNDPDDPFPVLTGYIGTDHGIVAVHCQGYEEPYIKDDVDFLRLDFIHQGKAHIEFTRDLALGGLTTSVCTICRLAKDFARRVVEGEQPISWERKYRLERKEDMFIHGLRMKALGLHR